MRGQPASPHFSAFGWFETQLFTKVNKHPLTAIRRIQAAVDFAQLYFTNPTVPCTPTLHPLNEAATNSEATLAIHKWRQQEKTLCKILIFLHHRPIYQLQWERNKCCPTLFSLTCLRGALLWIENKGISVPSITIWNAMKFMINPSSIQAARDFVICRDIARQLSSYHNVFYRKFSFDDFSYLNDLFNWSPVTKTM